MYMQRYPILFSKWKRVRLIFRIDDGELYSVLHETYTQQKSESGEVPKTEKGNTSNWNVWSIPRGTVNIYDATVKGKKFLSWQY
jgi:hypothetical protein